MLYVQCRSTLFFIYVNCLVILINCFMFKSCLVSNFTRVYFISYMSHLCKSLFIQRIFIIFGPNPRTQVSKPLQVQMTTPSTAQLACKTMPLDPSHSPTPCMPTCIKQPARPFPSFWACVTFEPPHAKPSLHLHVNHAKPTCFSLPTCSCPFHP